MARYIEETEIYKLVEPHGTAKVHCSQIDELLRADVVPKSEVEKIFAEIEKEIDTGLSVIEKILNTKSGRANGKTVLISKYDVYREAKKYIAELKNKYTEGEE